MSALLDPRREAFCHAYVRGPQAGKIGQAYAAAGYKYDSGNASRLFNDPDVQARIEELAAHVRALRHAAMRKAAARLGLDSARIARELSLIAFANPFAGAREDGSLDVTRLAGENGAAVREVNVEFVTLANGSQKIKRLRLAMHDKYKALGDLRRIMGGVLDDALLDDEHADAGAFDAPFASLPARRRLDLAAQETPALDAPDDAAADTQQLAAPARAHDGADDADGGRHDGSHPPVERSEGDGHANEDIAGEDIASEGRSQENHARDGEGLAAPPAAPADLPPPANACADAPREADGGPPSGPRRSAAPDCAHDLARDMTWAAIRDELARTPPGPLWLDSDPAMLDRTLAALGR